MLVKCFLAQAKGILGLHMRITRAVLINSGGFMADKKILKVEIQYVAGEIKGSRFSAAIFDSRF